MSATQDNVSFDWSMSGESADVASKPYLKKELLYVIDNNGSDDYSRNQVQFETVSLSNNGKWCDYRNGFISIPVVVKLEKKVGAVDLSLDQLLDIKSSNINIADSIAVEYNNQNVVQQTANISPYLVFRQHTTFSLQDTYINTHTGYRKDSSALWEYATGTGITNNKKAYMDNTYNFIKSNAVEVMTDDDIKNKGENTFEPDTAGHIYYYDFIIRLKDLLFFEKIPMIRGANIRITINLNQFELQLKRLAGGNISVGKYLKGSVVPIVCQSDILGANTNDEIELSLKVVKNGLNHVKKQCRLYVPVYTLNPEMEKSYLSLGQKKIVYEDVFVKNIKDVSVGQGFQELLTNSLSRMKRLVIVPMLSQSSNGNLTLTPQQSPFASEPSTCSPYRISNFNVRLSGSNIYNQNQDYTYETYLNEMAGCFGVNANQETGACSSMISLKDYNSNYGYIVVDLSRRYSYDDNTPMSVEINGRIESPLALDLLCFITFEKDLSIDLTSGSVV